MNNSKKLCDVNNDKIPDINSLENNLEEYSKLLNRVVLKKYLNDLSDLKVVPIDKSLVDLSSIRLFRITEMVYQKEEWSAYKFASVLASLQNLNCGVFILMDSDGGKTDFYMGVRSFDKERTTNSLKNTLKNALIGQFPGIKTEDLRDDKAENLLNNIPTKNISSVCCVSQIKDEEIKDDKNYVQGLEKLAVAMQGQKYTAVILASNTTPSEIDDIRETYESIYTNISPFANLQVSYGTNDAISISNAITEGETAGNSSSLSNGTSESESTTQTESYSYTENKTSFSKNIKFKFKKFFSHLTPNKEYANPNTTESSTNSTGKTISTGTTTQETVGSHHDISHQETNSETQTTGNTQNMQLNMQNKTLLDVLERIDSQLKRLDECESVGMWNCGAYFLSDTQETAEMAAGTYRAIMSGVKTGVETAAVNYWGRNSHKESLPLLREYITSFVHPFFEYSPDILLTGTSLLSTNETAIQMGLPRKSVCGFPVINHAEFGKEVVTYNKQATDKKLKLGNVYTMGNATSTEVNLDVDSLTMHTFVTGSTGSGKSNTIYEMLYQLYNFYDIPFLVVEPAKGEYKNVLLSLPNVAVYGTNPQKTNLLKINPFSFPEDIHVLEHVDRLVEIFNVCWPMYAAMPAILKDAMVKSYESTGWNLEKSINKNGRVFPTFEDLFKNISVVISESQYSSDSKSDYSGALLTRVRSLTTGLNKLIFCKGDISNEELFDTSVIADLSRVGSMETKSLIMGILVMKLNEYRMSSGKINSGLSHVTVLEEAHNLLKRTSTEQSSESSNLLGKSVELLSNSIAEMRTYGEGFIIADQAPGLLDMSAIRNTNTKIILRLPDYEDRKLVGLSAGLNSDQIEELAKLKKGVGAIYQNDWVEPVLVKIDKCKLKEQAFEFEPDSENTVNIELNDTHNNIKEQLMNFLISGRMKSELDFSTEDIKNNLDSLNLSVESKDFIINQIALYEKNKTLDIWKDENFKILSEKLLDVLGVRVDVEKYVVLAKDNEELTLNLLKLAFKVCPDASRAKAYTLCQCFMKDATLNSTNKKMMEKIYVNWVNFVKQRGCR